MKNGLLVSKGGIIWDTPHELYTSPRFQNLQAYLDTTGLCAFDEGYAPYSPHLIPIRGSADRLIGIFGDLGEIKAWQSKNF